MGLLASAVAACGALLPHRFTLLRRMIGGLFAALSLGPPRWTLSSILIPQEPGLSLVGRKPNQ